MKPGMQFNATKPLKAAEKALKAFGIAFESRRMKDISEPPGWADTSLGGSILYLEESRWEEGMSKLQEILGCTGQAGGRNRSCPNPE
jgi:hypothetical protein